MRNFIELINENNEIEEDCVEHDQVWRSTWTEWQNRDGIYLVLPGSNSVYVGFCSQDEAETYAATLGGDWRVIRHGRYNDLTDDEAEADPEIRHNRIKYGFYMKPKLEESESDPAAEDVERVIAELDAEGDITIMTRSWKRSYILHKMLGDEAWEKWLCAEVKKLGYK